LDGSSGSLLPLELPICYCIYFKANKYGDDDIVWLVSVAYILVSGTLHIVYCIVVLYML